MPTNKKMKKLLKASEAASHTDTQHVVLSVYAEGRVHASGTDDLVTGLIGDEELFSKVKTCIRSKVTEQPVGYATTHELAYAPLPCSPFSADWKEQGNGIIRGVLSAMLVTAGYGRGKGDRKLGVGPAPVGWPTGIDWAEFKGSTRSGLKVAAVTDIIVSMFQAAGLSPETHVKPTGEATRMTEAAAEDIFEDIIEEFVVQVAPQTNGENAKKCSGGLKRKFGSV
jgi:hypothetical protein